MKVVIIFDNFGPYHLARLEAANQVVSLHAVELSQTSADYSWVPSRRPRSFPWTRIDPVNSAGLFRRYAQAWRLRRALAEVGPDCVFIPGWSRLYALAALGWCLAKGVPVVMMSESTAHDLPRSQWKECLKSRILAHCSAALVGGAVHANYLHRLGVPRSRVFAGYDVVDNEYFRRTTGKVRERDSLLRQKFGLPSQYFLASARFVTRKNLAGLIRAYAQYRRLVASSKSLAVPWSLVLLGDGPQAREIRDLIRTLKLESFVLLCGFAQYPRLPVYYGLAGAFVHPSTSEPWGLVVNEAMASGLPVLVSNRCGCAGDLVRNGDNGFTFDPKNIEACAELMLRCSASRSRLAAMSQANLELISHWGPARFAEGVLAAAHLAVRCGPKPSASPGPLSPVRQNG